MSGIQFWNMKEAIITTNDSRLRLFNIDELLQKVKFKGYKGENLQLKSSLNSTNDRISMGSEDGNIFMWNIEMTHTRRYRRSDKPKQKAYEYFNPFNIPKIDTGNVLNRGLAGESFQYSTTQLEEKVKNSDEESLDEEEDGVNSKAKEQYDSHNRQNISNFALFVP